MDPHICVGSSELLEPQTTATSYSWYPPKLVRSLCPFHRHFWYATVTLGSYIPTGDLIRFHGPFHGALIPRLLTDLALQVFYPPHPPSSLTQS